MTGPLAEGWHEQLDNMTTWFFFPLLSGDVESPEYRFSLEFHISAKYTVFTEFFGPNFRLNNVSFRFEAPAYAHLYEEIFGCEVLFGQVNNSITYDVALCNHKVDALQAVIKPQVIEYCEQELAKVLIDGDIKKKIQMILLAQPGIYPDIESVSAMLSMHSRTLRRKLKLAQTSYREILLEIRRDQSVELLQKTTLSYIEVANRVGFSDVSSFRKAFLRWTNQQPSYYRKVIKTNSYNGTQM